MEKKEYVNRAAVLKILERYSLKNTSALGRHSGAVEAAMNVVESLPAADVVEVVRCKDCEHAQRQVLKKSGGFEGWVCEFDQEHFVAGNHFCSVGIRRQDG